MATTTAPGTAGPGDSRSPWGPTTTRGADSEIVRLIELFMFYEGERESTLERTNEYWDLYLGQRKEFRQKGEEWRANIHIPKPYANIQTKIANLASIALSADPYVQPEAVFDRDMDTAKSAERLLDYTYRKNEITKALIKLLTSRSICGTVFYKWIWADETHTIYVPQTPNATSSYQKYLEKIMLDFPNVAPSMPNWETQPEQFNKWRDTCSKAGDGYPLVAPPPEFGTREIVRYSGPRLVQLRMDDVYLDPLIDELRNQHCIIHRAVKPRSWVENKVARGIYSGKAVEAALKGWDGSFLGRQSERLAQSMDVSSAGDRTADPYYKDAVELLEFWTPFEQQKFRIVMNRSQVVNKNPEILPFWHGESSIGVTRVNVVPGFFYGKSDLEQPKDLFWEKDRLRSLRLDRATLDTLPVYTRLTEVGLPDNMYKLRPGQFIPVRRPDAVNPLFKAQTPESAYREPQELDADADDAMGTYGQIRGMEASIGRVTGTEFQGRDSRAQIRVKLDAMWFDEDFAPSHRQILSLYAQKSDPAARAKITGKPDPFLNMSQNNLISAMEMMWRFRGATKAIQRDTQVQQLYLFLKAFQGGMTPQELRFAAKLVLEMLDVRGVSKIVSEEGTAKMIQQAEMAEQAAAAQAQAQQQQMAAQQAQPPQQPQPGPPQEQGGGGEQPQQQ